jgi:WhiB family redox-sensing transcriptional regulator
MPPWTAGEHSAVITQMQFGVEAPLTGPADCLFERKGGPDMRHLLGTEHEDESWQDLANCLGVDPDLFFPERGASTREAKEVCRGCVVQGDCLEYALRNGEKFGIWGGMSERERRRIRRQRAVARAAALENPASA